MHATTRGAEAPAPRTTTRRHYRVARSRKAIGRFADALLRDLDRCGTAAEPRQALATVLDELLANVVMHARDARGVVHVHVRRRRGGVEARLRYRARAFDPTAHVPAAAPASIAEARIGGAGLPLVHALTSRFDYARRRGEERVCVCVAG